MRWLKAAFILIFALGVQLTTPDVQAQTNACTTLFVSRDLGAGKEIKQMSSLKVAAVQFPLAEAGSSTEFLAKVASSIQEAKVQGAELVVFPELITTELVDWYSKETSDVDQLTKIARDFAPKYIDWLKAQATAQQISILGGTTPREVNGKIVNTAILAFADGHVVFQDKLFLTPDEKAWGWVGGDALHVFDAPWGKTVIAICFDCEFPVVSNMLVSERPDVILVPSWTATRSGLNRVDFTARARAVEHYAYVVKTGTVAAEGARLPHYGQASLHTPQDVGFPTSPVEGKLNEAGLVFGTLDLKHLREQKKLSGYYPANEQSLRFQPIRIERK